MYFPEIFRQVQARKMACLLVVGGFFVGASSQAFGAAGYDAPDFDKAIVEIDALSLDEGARDEIATALTALASNFSESSEIDHDIREKALVLALTIRPLNPDARDAHSRLRAGKTPKPVDYFETLTAVSSALWKNAEKLSATEAEPEDRRMAPMLMEISLLVNPGKAPADRLRAFQRACELAPLKWKPFLTLQPAENPSNARAIALFRPVETASTPPVTVADASGPKNPATKTNPPNGDGKPTPGKDADATPVSEIKLTEAAITFIGWDRGARLPIGGVAGFEVREPTADENSLFGLFIDTETRKSFEMRLTYDRTGPPIVGIDRVETLIRKRYPKWPQNKLGEFKFQAAAGRAAPGELNLGIPALVLLHAAFSGEPINEAFGPAREFALTGGLNGSNIGMPPSAKIPDFAKVAAAMPIPPKALFLPDTAARAESELIDAAVAGDPSVLIRPQLIVFDSLEALATIVGGETPADLASAIEDFNAVQNLTGTMEFGAMVRNGVVQDRLRGILEKWPGHLSAKALLAFGTRPVDLNMSNAATVEAVEKALNPVGDHYESLIDGTGGGLVSAGEDLVNTAIKELAEMRSKISPEARAYLAEAERTLGAYKVFLSLNNRDSSIGKQRHRELQEQVGVLNRERNRLSPESSSGN